MDECKPLPGRMDSVRSGRSTRITHIQGLTLIHFSAQRKNFLWDTLGTCSIHMGPNSSQTGNKRAH